jgi:hypothetical protein
LQVFKKTWKFFANKPPNSSKLVNNFNLDMDLLT